MATLKEAYTLRHIIDNLSSAVNQENNHSGRPNLKRIDQGILANNIFILKFHIKKLSNFSIVT